MPRMVFPQDPKITKWLYPYIPATDTKLGERFPFLSVFLFELTSLTTLRENGGPFVQKKKRLSSKVMASYPGFLKAGI